MRKRTSSGKERGFLRHHSLGLASVAILILWMVLYSRSNPDTHLGSFFGNAIADWSGVVVIVFATKYLYECGSSESRQPSENLTRSVVLRTIRDHSLSIFLLITGAAWIAFYEHLSPTSKWGQVVGNIVSEWTQILGLVIMTKRLIETHSKEGR
jgi:hypothetical protein